jgi:COMPASS component SWD2
MAPGRFFRETVAPVVSLDFHRTEDLLVVAAGDDSLRLYDTAAGTLLKTVLGKTYGVGRVACTHAPLAVLTASGSNRTDHDVRYHSLYDNTYLRFFKVSPAGERSRLEAALHADVCALLLTSSLSLRPFHRATRRE